jgi:hypothetical protein
MSPIPALIVAAPGRGGGQSIHSGQFSLATLPGGLDTRAGLGGPIMAKASEFPTVEVAVALIAKGEQILAVYNPRWGSFTLPMTKRREWQDPEVPHARRHEDWVDAAARAGAEWLGRTCEPEFVLDDPGGYQQSDRDGAWRRYHFQVFRVEVEGEPRLVEGAIAEWLTPVQILSRRPISPTARYVIAKLKEGGKL